jgi:O-antigen/teichoic acid export membrane protein
MSLIHTPSPLFRKLLPLLPAFIKERIERKFNLQDVAINIGWLAIDKTLRLSLGLVVAALLARFLGPEQYGVWSYAIAFASLFGIIASLGLDGVVVRELVTSPERRDEILGSAFLLKLCGGILAFVVAITTIVMLKPSDRLMQILLVLTAGSFIFEAFGVIDLFFQYRVSSKYSILSKDAAFVLVTALRLGLIVTGASLVAFAATTLVEAILGATFLAFAYVLRGESFRNWRGSVLVASRLMRDSWPLAFSGLAIMIYMRIDQIMLGELIGQRQVGWYAAALRLSELWYFVPIAIAGSMFPRIVDLRRSNVQEYERRIQQLYDFLTWLSIGGALLISLIAVPVIRLLYGDLYLEAAKILRIHVWTGVFVTLGIASGKYLLAENLAMVVLFRSVAGAVLNVLLNVVLIRGYGVIGAAISTLIAQMLAAYGFDLLFRSTRQMFFMKTRSLFFVNALNMVSHKHV